MRYLTDAPAVILSIIDSVNTYSYLKTTTHTGLNVKNREIPLQKFKSMPESEILLIL